MRNAIIAVLMLALAGAGSTYFYFSPRLALAEIQKAAKNNDTATLAERVDFPRLRAGVKEQLDGLIQQKVARELGHNPFAAFGTAMATAAVDSLVDAYVSPAAIGALAGGLSPRHAAKTPRRALPEPPIAPAAEDPTPDRPKAGKAAVVFNSLSHASAIVTGKHGEKVRFELQLEAWHWRLVNIIFPQELFP